MDLQQKSGKIFQQRKGPFSEAQRRKLKAARLAAGLTLEELARGTGYDSTTFSRMEAGRRAPTPRLLAAWHRRLQSPSPRRKVKQNRGDLLPWFSEAIRQQLKDRRKALGLTFAQLADGTGYSLTTFSGVENGCDKPSARLIAAWTNRLQSIEKRHPASVPSLPFPPPLRSPAHSVD